MKIKNIISLFVLIVCASCSNFLEEYSQDTDYVRTWKDLDELLIGDCYLPVMESNYLNMTDNVGSWLHLLGDEVEECQSGGVMSQGDHRENAFGYFTWQQRVGQNENYTDFFSENKTWTKIYYCINVANNILSSVEELPAVGETDQQGIHKVKGEAHFLRAYYYFWLANLYGKPYNAQSSATDLCVPIKTSSMVEDKKFARNTVAEVYEQVLSDLDKAEYHLSKYRKAKHSIYRADSTACHLLQSRVYLYMQNWAKASEYARKVMNEHPSLVNLNTARGKFLTRENVENIFSMGGNDVSCIFNYACQSFSISKELYDSYSGSDLRRSQWYWHMGSFVGPVRSEVYNGFFRVDATKSDYFYNGYYINHNKHEVSGLFLMRSVEAYMNYAEANAYMGNAKEALSALNMVRKNRYSNSVPYELNLDGNELVSAVRRERKLEFPVEGHRWFDLRRYSVCSVMPESHPITHEWSYYSSHLSEKMTERRSFTLEANDPAYTLPIPHEVIEFNTGMENNERPWREYKVKSK